MKLEKNNKKIHLSRAAAVDKKMRGMETDRKVLVLGQYPDKV
jgi:hypothetical protein